MTKNRSFTVILRSCLTDKVVWIYRGPSKEAARKAYWRACRKELERVRNWGERMAWRTAGIKRLLSACLDDKPAGAELTPDQQAAAKELQSISKKGEECHREFYNHIIEERRRRKEDKKIRQKMRERQNEKKQ